MKPLTTKRTRGRRRWMLGLFEPVTVLLLLWPLGLVSRPNCLAVIAVELWRRKRYPEEMYAMKKEA